MPKSELATASRTVGAFCEEVIIVYEQGGTRKTKHQIKPSTRLNVLSHPKQWPELARP